VVVAETKLLFQSIPIALYTSYGYGVKDRTGDQRGGEWEPQIRFEKPERKSPDYTRHTSNNEYLYRVAQNGYRHKEYSLSEIQNSLTEAEQ